MVAVRLPACPAARSGYRTKHAMIHTRQDWETFEDRVLAPYAARSAHSRASSPGWARKASGVGANRQSASNGA